MTDNERISQLEEMMSETLKRIDNTLEQLRLSDQRQQVMLRALMQQTDTNTAMLRKLAEHDTRLDNLERPGPKNAA
ncbi:hypothetical protein [Hymenobacter rubripertinctus]|uniref:Uncharacterized protein n=1 Tax=Hymenobacter rubripertinctus TaxID=2029981 RepID=A0A418QY25_9BACT|nr:hypothetical protein [Hymenobacter rubripertinctus]RIY10073.1 hypothetical protein D0T11_11075 [Hymenobacter rubripertinctus]